MLPYPGALREAAWSYSLPGVKVEGAADSPLLRKRACQQAMGEPRAAGLSLVNRNHSIKDIRAMREAIGDEAA
jgi:hypothetical protein